MSWWIYLYLLIPSLDNIYLTLFILSLSLYPLSLSSLSLSLSSLSFSLLSLSLSLTSLSLSLSPSIDRARCKFISIHIYHNLFISIYLSIYPSQSASCSQYFLLTVVSILTSLTLKYKQRKIRPKIKNIFLVSVKRNREWFPLIKC